MPNFARYSFAWMMITVVSVVACKERASTEGSLAAANTSLTDDPNWGEVKNSLIKAGFTEAEATAVKDSTSISEWLGVASFVDDANNGFLSETPETKLRRESHGKTQGCLRARFDIKTTNGPGAFKAGASYPAWIRLSNGGTYQRDDRSTHISRGWGIKLLGVEGTPLNSQDFVILSSPIFFISDLTHYPGFLKATGEGKFGLLSELLFSLNFEEKRVVVRRLMQKVSNLLDSNLYSAVPYQFGDHPVKYAVAPCSKEQPDVYPPNGIINDTGTDYLEDAMNKTLSMVKSGSGLCYGFFVQRQRSAALDSLDNPTQEWGGSFEKVAEILIPAGQDNRASNPWSYKKNSAICEQMSFTPWNSTQSNLPIGKVNLTRRYVYARLADFRRTRFPKIYQRWLANHADPSVRDDFKAELAKLKNPQKFIAQEQSTAEPTVDQGFRDLKITSER